MQKREAWVEGCDEGDVLVEAAKSALAEGELDEASKGCRGAREAYERVHASEQLRGLEQVEGQIVKKQQVEEAEDELADGCAAFPLLHFRPKFLQISHIHPRIPPATAAPVFGSPHS